MVQKLALVLLASLPICIFQGCGGEDTSEAAETTAIPAATTAEPATPAPATPAPTTPAPTPEPVPGCGIPPLTGKTGCDDDCVGLAFVDAAGVCAGCEKDSEIPITADTVDSLDPPAVLCVAAETTAAP
jgi:hypothetical protein